MSVSVYVCSTSYITITCPHREKNNIIAHASIHENFTVVMLKSDVASQYGS